MLGIPDLGVNTFAALARFLPLLVAGACALFALFVPDLGKGASALAVSPDHVSLAETLFLGT